MKKIKLGTIFLALSLSMVLVSCGGTPEEKVQTYVEQSLATPDMQDMITQTEAAGMELVLVADGTSIKYQYTITTNVDDLGGAEAVAASIEASLNDPIMVEIQDSALVIIKEECPEVTSIIYEYYDNAGNLLTTKEVQQVQ